MKDKGGDVPKVAANARRKKNVILQGVAYDEISPQTTGRPGKPIRPGFVMPKMPQYRVPGTNSWTWINPVRAKRIASRFKKGER